MDCLSALKIKVRPHALLTRKGDDLAMTLPVTVPEAVLGATVTAPTLAGEVRVKVPKGSQTGQKLRLRGKGALNRKTGKTGDMILLLEVRAPEGEGKDIEKAVKALTKHYPENLRAELELEK